jgi:hypothetical protein
VLYVCCYPGEDLFVAFLPGLFLAGAWLVFLARSVDRFSRPGFFPWLPLRMVFRWWRRILRAAPHVSRAPSASLRDAFGTLDTRASAALSQALTGRLRLPSLMPATTTEQSLVRGYLTVW